MWGACWLFLTKGAADSDCGCSFGIIQPWHPASLHICENPIQKRSLSRTWAGSQRGRGWQKKGMGDVTEERGGRKEEMKKNRKKESGDNIFCINLNVYQVRWQIEARGAPTGERTSILERRGRRRSESGCERTERESICVVSAAICVSEHITQTVRPVPTPPASPCCLLGTSTRTSTASPKNRQRRSFLSDVWLHFALTHTPSLWSTTCMSISEPIARGLVYWGFLLVE